MFEDLTQQERLIGKAIPGYPDYFATLQGDIVSTLGGKLITLKGVLTNKEYLSVNLYRKYMKKVHRLVALAYHGEPTETQVLVRHLDDCKTNNRPDNLAWGTHIENMRDKYGEDRKPSRERKFLYTPHNLPELSDDQLRLFGKKIPGYSDYLATLEGTILSIKNFKVVGQSTNKYGYKVVSIINDCGVKKKWRVHRLIALACHGDPPEGCYLVRHLDNNKTNNRPDNLAWGTYLDNASDRQKAGTHPNYKLSETDVLEIRQLLEQGKLTNKEIGKSFGVNRRTISGIKTGQTWKNL